MGPRSRLLLVIAAVLAVTAVWVSASAGATAPRASASISGVRAIGDCMHRQVRPRTVIVACGDGNFYVQHIHWVHFGGHSALGHGVARVNTCRPDCAGGHFPRYAARITLTSPTHRCRGLHAIYGRITVRFLHRRVEGHRQTSSPAFCPRH